MTLPMWPWLLVCAGVATMVVVAYLLGIEVGKGKR